MRYRYDAQRKKRFKTVELIVAERDWEPSPSRLRSSPDTIVALHVPFADRATREQVKQAGGTWDPGRKTWHLPYDRVVGLGLAGRIVDEPASDSRCRGARGRDLSPDAGTPSR
jgi:hypothetical protein